MKGARSATEPRVGKRLRPNLIIARGDHRCGARNFDLIQFKLRLNLTFCKMSCHACNKHIEESKQLKCVGCNGTYHFFCINLTEAQFAKNKNREWWCSFCASVNSRRRRNDNTPVQRNPRDLTMDDSVMSYCDDAVDDSSLERDVASASVTVNSTLPLPVTPPNSYQLSKANSSTQFASYPGDILTDILGKITALQAQFSSFQGIQSDLSQVKTDLAEMRGSLDTKLDALAGTINSLESRVSALEDSRAELDEVKDVIGNMTRDFRRNEQWVRRSNIQLNGIPETKGENLFTIVKALADRSGYSLNTNTDIDFVTRVAVKNDVDNTKPKPIVLKMQARYKKDDFMSSLRKLKNLKASDLGYSNSPNRIYINDHLSSYNKFLLKEAKQRANQKRYQFCWVRNCTIMVRRNEKSPVLYITSEEALNKII